MKVRRPRRSPPGLMLTSLLDMFTIILIFLIVSYDAEEMDFTLDNQLTLPESAAENSFKPAANVSITAAGVKVEGHRVAQFVDGRPAAESVTEKQLPNVVEALEKVRLVLEAEASERGEELDEKIVILQADKDLEYSTLYLVMRSARLAGFAKYRLAVLKK